MPTNKKYMYYTHELSSKNDDIMSGSVATDYNVALTTTKQLLLYTSSSFLINYIATANIGEGSKNVLEGM